MRNHLATVQGLIAALVMAAGVTMLAAGLFAYAPSTLGDWRTPEPSLTADDPLFGDGPTAAPSTTRPSGGSTPGASPGTTVTPTDSGPVAPATPGPTPTPAPQERAYATRIRLPVLRIDLPVVPGDLAVPGNEDNYPLCDVAMYLPEFVQPGEAGTAYIYAHAQRGMFLPLLRASEVNDGAALLGALVEVYTSRDELHLYEIVRVKRHATDLSLVTDAGDAEQLVLQTSEGPAGTLPKLQVAARPVSVIGATTAEAQPVPQPRVCRPG